MGQDWVVLLMGAMMVLAIGLVIVLIGAVGFGVWEYTTKGWQQYTLDDNDWHRLQLHEQTMERGSNA